jgi:DNA gyrase subunit A
MAKFGLSEIQSKAILDMRLQRLTNLETTKIRAEYQDILKKIAEYKAILADVNLRMGIIKDELDQVAKRFGDDRRTEIVHSAEDFRVEDMIANEDVVVTISNAGYIKRTPLKSYSRQKRGGVGAKGAATRDEDFLKDLFIASTHNYMLFFTEKGKVFWLKVFEIPEGGRSTKGRAIQNLIALDREDRVITFVNVTTLDDAAYLSENYLLFCTKQGTIKKTSLEEYSRPRASGIIAINITEGDELLSVQLCTDQSEVVIATRMGNAIRFKASDLRPIGRNSQGVRGMTLQGSKDSVIGMVVVNRQNTDLLTLSENGYGKRSHLEDYRLQGRGGKGVKTINITPKTGDLVGIVEVNDGEDLMILTTAGLAIRMPVNSIPTTSRATQGVRLIRLKDTDQIATVVKVAKDEDEGEEGEESAEDTGSGELFEDTTAE